MKNVLSTSGPTVAFLSLLAASAATVSANPCIPGYFGADCLQRCHCQDSSEICDSFGHCLSGCQAGYTGRDCSQECGPGQYGPNCAKQCECGVLCACHPATGACTTPQCISLGANNTRRGNSSLGLVLPVAFIVILLLIGCALLVIFCTRTERGRGVGRRARDSLEVTARRISCTLKSKWSSPGPSLDGEHVSRGDPSPGNVPFHANGGSYENVFDRGGSSLAGKRGVYQKQDGAFTVYENAALEATGEMYFSPPSRQREISHRSPGSKGGKTASPLLGVGGRGRGPAASKEGRVSRSPGSRREMEEDELYETVLPMDVISTDTCSISPAPQIPSTRFGLQSLTSPTPQELIRSPGSGGSLLGVTTSPPDRNPSEKVPVSGRVLLSPPDESNPNDRTLRTAIPLGQVLQSANNEVARSKLPEIPTVTGRVVQSSPMESMRSAERGASPQRTSFPRQTVDSSPPAQVSSQVGHSLSRGSTSTSPGRQSPMTSPSTRPQPLTSVKTYTSPGTSPLRQRSPKGERVQKAVAAFEAASSPPAVSPPRNLSSPSSPSPPVPYVSPLNAASVGGWPTPTTCSKSTVSAESPSPPVYPKGPAHTCVSPPGSRPMKSEVSITPSSPRATVSATDETRGRRHPPLTHSLPASLAPSPAPTLSPPGTDSTITAAATTTITSSTTTTTRASSSSHDRPRSVRQGDKSRSQSREMKQSSPPPWNSSTCVPALHSRRGDATRKRRSPSPQTSARRRPAKDLSQDFDQTRYHVVKTPPTDVKPSSVSESPKTAPQQVLPFSAGGHERSSKSVKRKSSTGFLLSSLSSDTRV